MPLQLLLMPTAPPLAEAQRKKERKKERTNESDSFLFFEREGRVFCDDDDL